MFDSHLNPGAERTRYRGLLNKQCNKQSHAECSIFISLSRSIFQPCKQGRSQPHTPGWARVPLSSFFLKFLSIILIFSSKFPNFRPPGKALATPLLVQLTAENKN